MLVQPNPTRSLLYSWNGQYFVCRIIVCKLLFHHSGAFTQQNVGEHCSRCLAPFTHFVAVYSKI